MQDDIVSLSRFVAATGVQVQERRPGYACLRVSVEPRHLDVRGLVHGGVITSAMDTALAVALRELRGEGATVHSSIEMNASFLGTASGGDELAVEGRITHLQPTVAFGEAEVRRSGGELLALGRVTFAIQQPKL
jgi:acyl-CoA thioesterase